MLFLPLLLLILSLRMTPSIGIQALAPSIQVLTVTSPVASKHLTFLIVIIFLLLYHTLIAVSKKISYLSTTTFLRLPSTSQVASKESTSQTATIRVAWNKEVKGESRSNTTISTLPKVDVNKHHSTPDLDSMCFTIAITPSACKMHVNWRERWSNEAVFWHTSLLEQYSLEYGLETSAAKMQEHISNIIDWSLGERADEIYRQAQAMVKKKVGEDLPLPAAKRQRI